MGDGPIDFSGLNESLLGRAETLVPQWLPGGKRRGREWVCGSLQGGEGDSTSVNLHTGAWADFASDERGGDLVSLYAAIHNMSNGAAARELMRELGHAPPPPRRAAPPAPREPDERADGKRRSLWKPVVPVPDFAPAADFRHWHYEQPEATWAYRINGQLLGYVVRFRTSTGGKEILPYTWCTDESDKRGTQRWHWKQWDEPRPLFVPAGDVAGAEVLVVVVEGEKCATAGHGLVDGVDWVTWPGGAKAWDKADWAWIAGRRVVLWPDCDAKRVPLTRAEREAGADPTTKPLLPQERQPGWAAMVALGRHLQAARGCEVSMCKTPPPGDVADGWDVADAIAQGWTADQVRAFVHSARPLPAEPAGTGSTRPRAGAEGSDDSTGDRREWKHRLHRSREGAPRAIRENLVIALDGVPDEDVPGIEAAAGLIRWNEFTNDVVKARPTPWGTGEGLWQEVDELLLGEWLVRVHRLPSVPRGTLEEAVRMVAYRHSFHPVRDYLQGLKWDSYPRLRTWLRMCCLEEDEWDDRDPLQRYLAAAGTYWLMGLCQRVLLPGCKFDYMLVLESARQGIGKSTLLRTLGGAWFADTGLVLGDKDSYQQLQGRWVYEMGELDALSKIEITKVKQYIASQSDYFRASFDRRAREYPRQVVFGGTTNDDQYLIDSSGNRRFWPVRVTRRVDIDWLAENRDQLFAEACARLAAGKRFHPSPDEERELFWPQQESRRVVGPIEAAVVEYLYDEDQKAVTWRDPGHDRNEITLGELLHAIGYSADKQTDLVHKRAAAVMRRLGWEHRRSSKAGRPWVYRRPARATDPMAGASMEPTGPRDAAAEHERADSDCPF